MSIKVESNKVSSAVDDILNQYTADIHYGIREVTDEKAEKLKKLIQEGAPVNKRKSKRRGTYKRSWKVKVEEDSFSTYEKKICSPREYRLTHLLEKGHKAPRGGKHVEAQPHIKPAADKIEVEYVKGIEKIVQTSKQYGGGRRNTTKSYKR